MQLFDLAAYQPTSNDGFTKRVFQNSPRGLVFTLTFMPGQALPEHTHGQSELLATVLTGSGEATVDGKKAALAAGALLHCEGHETFSLENTGSTPLSVLVVLYPGEARFANDVR